MQAVTAFGRVQEGAEANDGYLRASRAQAPTARGRVPGTWVGQDTGCRLKAICSLTSCVHRGPAPSMCLPSTLQDPHSAATLLKPDLQNDRRKELMLQPGRDLLSPLIGQN